MDSDTVTAPTTAIDGAGARLLVVDDEPQMSRSMNRMLTAKGYECMAATDADAARQLLSENTFELILTDMNMPGDSGLDLIADVMKRFPATAMIMITGRNDVDLAEAALEAGAYGYIAKPFEKNELIICVSNALRRRELEIENRNYRERLEAAVDERTRDLWEAVRDLESLHDALRSAHTQTLERLAIAAEFRDDETGNHIRRMSRYCKLLARQLGMDEIDAENLRLAGAMHDVGKIGIPDRILLKPRQLTPDEFETIKEHPDIGYRILSGTGSELLDLAATIALTHHERFDGTGYPSGFGGQDIPLPGRIAAVADVFDALTTDRVYRKAYKLTEALEIMRDGRDAHFDPDVLDSFLDSLPAALEIKDQAARATST